ncbi:sulfatase [Natronococcus amylolyticus DSM 10524]|uniref:Sulfatase n=2 Tax=Natronococcus amylolyticus TaxID=44470 RepID=L9WZM3_9EURY|nr:sulfatase [Natronococcus amylolyticus DSM 10524]
MDTARYDESFGTAAPPTIADLCDNGTKFTNAFAAAPWTLPSHASVFSGQYPSKHGSNATAKQFNPSAPSVIEAFDEAGHETVAVSNNTWISGEFGFDRGFDQFRKNWQFVQADADPVKIARENDGIERWKELARHIFDGNPPLNALNALYAFFQHRHGSDDGAKRANDWVKEWLDDREESDPFFLFLNYMEPHLEYAPPQEYTEQHLPDGVTFKEAMQVEQDAFRYIAGDLEMTERDFEILRALYRGEIAYLDEQIGNLRESLKRAGEWEDTVFVVIGDHGENIGDHGLMDHQYCLYDTLIHVPLVIHGGAFTNGGERTDLVQLTDLAPSLLDAADIEAPEFRDRLQGQSFHPQADTDPREYVYAEYMAPQPSMDALEKRVSNPSEEVYKYDRSLRAIRGTDWKLIRGSDGTRELYQVSVDQMEADNRSETEPEQAERLEQQLDDWLESFTSEEDNTDADMDQNTKNRLEDLGYLQ